MKGHDCYTSAGHRAITIVLADADVHRLGEAILRVAAEKLAERWVEEHGQEVLALIRPEAVATLAVAEAGVAIRETLQKKLPDRVDTIIQREREIWQRGVFGGLSRVR